MATSSTRAGPKQGRRHHPGETARFTYTEPTVTLDRNGVELRGRLAGPYVSPWQGTAVKDLELDDVRRHEGLLGDGQRGLGHGRRHEAE